MFSVIKIGSALLALIAFIIATAKADELKSQVTLSLDEFQEIFSSARLENAERRVLDKKKIQDAAYEKKLQELNDLIEKAKLQAQTATKQAKKSPSTILDDPKEIERQQQIMFPNNYQILQHTAKGIFNTSSTEASGVERDIASFHLDLTLRVMESSTTLWTSIPLVNTSSTVASNFQVSLKQQPSIDDNKSEIEEEEEETDDSVAREVASSLVDGQGTYQTIDTVSNPNVLLLIRDDQQMLVTNQPGLYKISFTAYTRVGKNRNLNTIGLSSLLYPLTDISLTIAKKEQQYQHQDFSIQPPSSVLHVYPHDNHTNVEVTLPLQADNFQIRWTDIMVVDDITRDVPDTADAGAGHHVPPTSSRPSNTPSQQQQQVTATHEVIHTVGEGSIIRSTHNLEFKTTNQVSPLSSVEFEVHGDNGDGEGGGRGSSSIRINSVLGHALESWTADPIKVENSTTAIAYHLVKAYFKTSQVDSSSVLFVLFISNGIILLKFFGKLFYIFCSLS